VEELALDRSPLEHAPLCRLELIQPRGEQRPERRRNGDSPSASPAIATISVRNSGLPPAARAIRARRSSSTLSAELVGLARCERLSRMGAAQEGRRSISSGRAMQEEEAGHRE
jgi:hypothetical protein